MLYKNINCKYQINYQHYIQRSAWIVICILKELQQTDNDNIKLILIINAIVQQVQNKD